MNSIRRGHSLNGAITIDGGAKVTNLLARHTVAVMNESFSIECLLKSDPNGQVHLDRTFRVHSRLAVSACCHSGRFDAVTATIVAPVPARPVHVRHVVAVAAADGRRCTTAGQFRTVVA